MTPTDVDVLTNDDERAGSHEITSGRLTRPLPVEQRNDFFGRVKFTLGVLMETAGQENGGGAGGHVPVYGDAGTLLRVLPKFLGASIGIKPILQTSADGTQDIVSALQDHEVDVVYSRINVDVALERKISYSFAVYHEFRNVYLRQPELSEIRDIYLAPITTTLAVAFLALTITLAVMLRLINNLHVTTRWKRNQHAPPTDHVSGSDAFLWFMGIFCMQGSTINPNCQSSATIVITALLFQLIVYNAYSASITSKLSIYLDEVTDLHGLLHATDFEVGFVRNRSDEAYLVANRDRDTSEILKRSMKNPTIKVEHYREGLHRAVETKFALFGRHGAVRGAIRNLAATDFCEGLQAEQTIVNRSFERLTELFKDLQTSKLTRKQFWDHLKSSIKVTMDQQTLVFCHLIKVKKMVELLYYATYFYAIGCIGSSFFLVLSQPMSILLFLHVATVIVICFECYQLSYQIDCLKEVFAATSGHAFSLCAQLPYAAGEHRKDYLEVRTTLMIIEICSRNVVCFRCFDIPDISVTVFVSMVKVSYSVLTFLLNTI
ncbi:uncharacterized protein LOC120423293 isoform X1 [Culex pipiens pallens]|uniref:uncharacterized protein LOC120423293 isoform X1 n=1 Tax=Culex pipiens pallens TaxID=42434 RepID=UPI001953B78F|nr:uncharacterized protein LOC120423293 isoform X1 [Culex pipiens pallens]